MPSTYTPITTTTLSSAQASVTFSSISQTYTDLIMVCTGSVVNGGAIEIQVGNGSIDTGTNYSRIFIFGSSTTAGSGKNSNLNQAYASFGTSVASTEGLSIINFQNYSNTSTFKTLLIRSSQATADTGYAVTTWRSTSAINTIKINGYTSNMNAGSTFTLYGVKAA